MRHVLLLCSCAAVIAGIVVTAAASSQPATIGWFGYTPLSAGDRLEGLHVVSTTGLVGFAVLSLGLIALAFWACLHLGTRRVGALP
ncbi:hypothetical protein [Arthrobacter sp. JSM 101049]|uniref:hypothetical protein n=1 Tax=Arthrobacter sp. JSM 101049 TaxID=929097 RepID=UPI003562F741